MILTFKFQLKFLFNTSVVWHGHLSSHLHNADKRFYLAGFLGNKQNDMTEDTLQNTYSINLPFLFI